MWFCTFSLRPGGVLVQYSLVFELNVPEITATDGTKSSTESGLRDMVSKVLQEDMSLPVDLDSLDFLPGTEMKTFQTLVSVLELRASASKKP